MQVKIASNEVIHFVGIGGIGMSGLAQIMHNMGFMVQGSDLCQSKNTDRLRKFGIKIFIGHKKKNIKNLLMDQTFVSGLGNIYVNEVLFLSKIHPLRQCSKLEKKNIMNLITSIKKVLKISIHKGGSSIKDFKNAYGKSCSFQQLFKVYGQENKNCSRISCKGKIKKIKISNRSSFYCNKCQN